MEVNHILRVGPLDGDGKGLERVEGEGNQAPYRMVYWPAQKASLNFKLQKARVPGVKPVWDGKQRHRCTGAQVTVCMTRKQPEEWNRRTFVFSWMTAVEAMLPCLSRLVFGASKPPPTANFL